MPPRFFVIIDSIDRAVYSEIHGLNFNAVNKFN